MPGLQELLDQYGIPTTAPQEAAPGNPLAVPTGGQTEDVETPVNDALGGEIAGLRRLMQSAREAAENTPDKRAEKIYKDKIRSMFGVKLGEKNPKWKSILRGLGQGFIDFGLGYSGQPGLKGQARQQAMEEYKAENAVLGREGMGALAPLVNLAGQESRAKTAAAKQELAERFQSFKENELTAKGKLHFQRAKLFESQGKLNEARAELALANVEKTQAQTQDIGKTGVMREIEALKRGDISHTDLANRSGAISAGQTIGKGIEGPQQTNREVVVPNPLTGQMETRWLSTIRQPKGNPGAAQQFLDRLKGSTETTPAAPPAAPPSIPGNAPTVENAIPNAVPVSETPKATAAPRANGNPASKAIQATTNAALQNGTRTLGVMTPKAAEKFKDLQDISENMKSINEAMFGAATEYDEKGRSTGNRYTGLFGKLINTIDRSGGNQSTQAAAFKEANDRAFNLHRKLITGAGAGWKELDFLKARFPTWGEAWTADNFETSLQKALVLHFTSQKHLWNFEKQGIDPLRLAATYNGEKMVQRVDDILARYKELNAKIPTAPDSRRKEMIAGFKKYLEQKLDGRDMFDAAWTEANGRIAPPDGVKPTAAPAKRRIRIEVP